jgi:hypothetical protein
MDAPEVVPGVPEDHSGPVVFPFFAVAIRQPSESFGARSQAQIASLNNQVGLDLVGVCEHQDVLQPLAQYRLPHIKHFELSS